MDGRVDHCRTERETQENLLVRRASGIESPLLKLPDLAGYPTLRALSRPCGRLADLAVFEDFVEYVGEGGGAAAGGVLRGLEVAGERVETLAGGAEFVGDVEGGEDGDAEAVDCVALGGDGAHFGVDNGGETFDVGGIGAAEMVDLVVDVDRDGLALGGLGRGLGGFEGLGSVHRLFHRVSFMGLEEFVDLLEHFFYAKADVFALFVEGGDFGFDGACVGFMGGEFFAERGDFGFGVGAGFAFALDDFYGTEDFLFERLKLVDADARAEGRCTHIFSSIDGGSVDSPEGNRGGIYLDAAFFELNG